MTYLIRKAMPGRPPTAAASNWDGAGIVYVDQFHPKSSDHHPRTIVRALYDPEHLHVRFEVHDRFIRSTHVGYQSMVSKDSCVEFFAQPKNGKGYFNFEMNCGGHLLLHYIEDPMRMPDRFFKKSTPVPVELAATHVRIEHSLPKRVDPEIVEPIDWWLQLRIDFELFEQFVGPLDERPGSSWRGNFFKCAEENSHPHWAAWSRTGGPLRFHQPQYFGELRFE